MQANERYIIDTNVLIAAYKQYYSFDITPKFWEYLAEAVKSGKIIVIDKVINEIKVGDDDLSKWVISTCKDYIFDSANYINSYSDVLNHVHDCGYYNENATKEWAEEKLRMLG